MKHTAYISLGSNLGDREKNLNEALKRLAEIAKIVKISSLYETDPWGYSPQPKFLNQAVEIQTDLSPKELLNFLKGIEEAMGRTKTFRYGPRNIDLDILFYDDLVCASESLIVPHPDLPQRAFVLIPLNEIAPHYSHPSLKKTIADLAGELDSSGVHKFHSPTKPKGKMLEWGKRTYIMGVINLTPDSFSGDGLMAGDNFVERAVKQALEFVRDGADILDLGAESSRPGSQPVSTETEIARLLPVLEAICAKSLPAIISIDTWKPAVAEKCLSTGADWINDIWGLTADPHLASVVAKHSAAIILMHNRSRQGAIMDLGGLGKSYEGAQYHELISGIKASLENSARLALSAGVSQEKIILDPGLGFGKNMQENLELINHLDDFKSLGFPLLVGPSRKSFIGQVLGLPVEEREEGTAAVVALSIARGADIVRVHNVKAMARVARMADAIVRGGD